MQSLFDLGIAEKKRPAKRPPTGRKQYRRRASEDYHRPQVYAFSLIVDDSLPSEREARIAAMAARWQAGVPLIPANEMTLIDFVAALESLGMSMWEESLAKRGLRECLSGIHRTDNGRYRIRPGWDSERQRHGSVVNGYADTLGEAKSKLIAWWKSHRNIDITYTPPPWFIELVGDAERLQSEQSGDADGLTLGVLPDDDEDD